MKFTVLIIIGSLFMSYTANAERFHKTKRNCKDFKEAMAIALSGKSIFDDKETSVRPIFALTSGITTVGTVLINFPCDISYDLPEFISLNHHEHEDRDDDSQQKERIKDLRELEKIIERNYNIPSPGTER